MKLLSKKTKTPWIVFVDLMVALLALFVFAMVGLWAIKDEAVANYQQKSDEFTRKEVEYQKCVEEKKDAQQGILQYEAALGEKLKVEMQSGQIELKEGRVDIQAALLFGMGRTEIEGQGLNIIQSVGEAFISLMEKDTSFVLMVAGFTDDSPIKSEDYTNWELSAERSVQVVKILIKNGLPPSRIFAAGFGATHPKFSNTSKKNRAFNRRVEIVRVPISASQIISR